MRLPACAFLASLLISLAGLTRAVTASSFESPKEPASTARPVSAILKPDGSLDLTKGASGSFDMRGVRMVTGPDGEPRFEPSHPDRAERLDASESVSHGPESDPNDVYWDDQFPVCGTDWEVMAIATDGLGNAYIGGGFVLAGGVIANGIAKWDGKSWSALGSGVVGSVSAIALSGGDIIIGGQFSKAGGVEANNIAKWNCTSWSPLGTGVMFESGPSYAIVSALALRGNDLIAAGFFTVAGGVPARYIAKWDGTSWSALGGGTNHTVNALAMIGDSLFAGGGFTIAGEVSANYVAKWDGHSWSALGAGKDSPVFALAVDGNNLYVGGAGYIDYPWYVCEVSMWDGASWSVLGGSLESGDAHSATVLSLAVIGDDLYAGGDFISAGSVYACNIAKWNGKSWEPLGYGAQFPSDELPGVKALAVSGNDLFVGGAFRRVDLVNASCIAKWNGASWSALSGGIGAGESVLSLAVSGSDIYLGGSFESVGGISALNVAKWDGASWSALGSGIYGPVHALAVSGTDVFAAGEFNRAGGAEANNIAKWDGSKWSALGRGVNRFALALAVSGSDLYVGGAFMNAGELNANRIAKWDGMEWSALGSGANSFVHALAAHGSDLYAGGEFGTMGGVEVNGIAKWNGESWSALGSGTDGDVDTLAVAGNDLYAGGYFQNAGGVSASSIAKWNGVSWSALGPGLSPAAYSLAMSGNELIAAGSFQTAGGVEAGCVAKWDGVSWATLGHGVEGNRYPNVRAVAVNGNALFMGGVYSVAGGKASRSFSLWQPRVNVTDGVLKPVPGAVTIGNGPYGFFKPALMTTAGTTVGYFGGGATSVSLNRAAEIQVNGKRVNGAFALSPEGLQFGGAGATLRVEFSEDDVALFGGRASFSDFRAVRLEYPPDYPASKEAGGNALLAGQGAPVPVRVENGRKIFAITVPVTRLPPICGAIPESLVQPTGSLAVTLQPADAVVAGARWRRAGTGIWRGSGETETDVPVGLRQIEFSEAPGWSAPSAQMVTIASEELTSATGTYKAVVFKTWRDDKFATSGELTAPGTSATGWSWFGMNNAMAHADHVTTVGAYRGLVVADPDHFRVSGASANVAEWMPYSLVGPDHVVRAKYYMYGGGAATPGDLNHGPNLRLRLSNRFAVNSMLEVFHDNAFEANAAQQAMDAELQPSADPTSPSVYRVDFDPVDVPYLQSNASVEGVQRAFEAYGIYPQEEGFVAMVESVIGSYPVAAVPVSAAAAKVYAPDSDGAGDLGVFAPGELDLYNSIPGAGEGAFGTRQSVAPPELPTYADGAWGVTLDTTAVPTDRIGIATREFNPDRGTQAYTQRVRVEEGKQYAVRFHLTSTQQVNRQSQVRLRARSVKFAWSQKFEVGGAWATDAGGMYPLNPNNSIAQQALPGIGTANPDTSGTEANGGWYTMMVHTPMSVDIRPEFAAGTPLAVRMPVLAAQPGPGEESASRRDLLFGMDLVDTLSAGAGRFLEQGNVTLDRIEVRVFDLVAD